MYRHNQHDPLKVRREKRKQERAARRKNLFLRLWRACKSFWKKHKDCNYCGDCDKCEARMTDEYFIFNKQYAQLQYKLKEIEKRFS